MLLLLGVRCWRRRNRRFRAREWGWGAMSLGTLHQQRFNSGQILPPSFRFLNPMGFLPRGLNNLMVIIIDPVIRPLVDAQENTARRR